jgi:hypothetical protein
VLTKKGDKNKADRNDVSENIHQRSSLPQAEFLEVMRIESPVAALELEDGEEAASKQPILKVVDGYGKEHVPGA